MKLIKLNRSQVGDTKDVPGLLQCRLEYEVKTAKGRLEYHGPKFSPEWWHQVLSFFRWTHKEMHSESQVRLYVNPKLGCWGAWAFPQEARTGMSARELATPETPEKARERFAYWQSVPSDDWLYFGTVHHHCSSSAFQSGTDEANEQNQDGLHITVGRMDAEQHDVHARFYLDGNCYEPDLSAFWPIDPAVAALLPSSLHHEIARHQMGAKVTVDFPAPWRANLIEMTVSKPTRITPSDWRMEPDWDMSRVARVDVALEEIQQHCEQQAIPPEQWCEAINALAADETSQIIVEACLHHGITLDELLAELAQAEFGF